MLIGPVFAREVAIAPRRPRLYITRTLFCLLLLFLMSTAWLVLTGTQLVRDLGDLARFGSALFQLLAYLQLALSVFFSALLAASAVAQEKDRRTLVLLLLTSLSNSELVLGKLLASLLNVLVVIVAAVPVFMLCALFGGVSFDQIARMFAVTLASVLACGSLGSTLALWREKTFQAVAMTVLVLVLWLAVWGIVATGAVFDSWLGLSCQAWAAGFSPWQAIVEATRPYVEAEPALGPLGTPVHLFLLVAVAISVLLNGVAVAMVRVWNPSRESQPVSREEDTWRRQSIWGAEHDATRAPPEGASAADQTDSADRQGAPAGTGLLTEPRPGAQVSEPGGDLPSSVPAGSADPHRSPGDAPAPDALAPKDPRTRHVWDNPIIWREIRTWAYGRKILIVRLAYLVLFALSAGSLYWMADSGTSLVRGSGSAALAALFLLSLVLVNAQAVTSLTSERDGRALDLLLVSDLTPKEFVYGKLGGVFYNTKEMVVLPMLLCVYLWHAGALSLEELIYLLVGVAVLYCFAAMLGVHAGMAYENSRSAIGTSLGTVFFLFLGVAACMRIMLAFSGQFEAQLPFLGLIVFGGAGLYLALGVRNPSAAIGLASFACPLVTFYAITSFFMSQNHLAFVAIVAAYGFTTIAMLIPAIDEFDVATGRTTIGEQ
ncbi:MAG TPA: ABC transporter permease [Thermoguttaceae bacterium]|nr:ABC transporter permease [Thermoguttaceae bacterium]